MPNVPLLTAAQWHAVKALLPDNRHDKAMVTALLFRETTACGARDVADCFGVSKTRLTDWSSALQRDGTLPQILAALGLEPASPLQWRRGGSPHWKRNSRDGGAGMLQHLLDHFGAQLAARGRRK